MPAFSSPIDCTPWVIGGLWPAGLSTVTAENASVADYLRADLQRIASSANDQLKTIRRMGLSDLTRQAEEARVIDEARARAARRVESAVRYLREATPGRSAGYPRSPTASPPPDMDPTQVIPAVTDQPVTDAPARGAGKPRWRVANSGRRPQAPVTPSRDRPEGPPPETGTDQHPGASNPVARQALSYEMALEPDRPSVANGRHHAEPGEPVDSGRHHAVAAETVAGEPQPAEELDLAAVSMEDTQVIPVVREAAEPVVDEPPESRAETDEEPADSGRHHAVAADQGETEAVSGAFDVDRLNRLLEFVVRQEPRLNWAVGDHSDGTTVLVTDLAHGWIPSGIAVPAGVRLLEPERRAGRVAALVGDAARVVTYAPGDSLRRSADFTATKSSVEPRQLPAIEDLGSVLSHTIRRFDGLPRIVQRLADAAAAAADVIDQEVDVLRVHLDTARYQLLVQYPKVNPALLLKCLLMAATEGIASGDPVSANYHLAWYQKLATSPPGS